MWKFESPEEQLDEQQLGWAGVGAELQAMGTGPFSWDSCQPQQPREHPGLSQLQGCCVPLLPLLVFGNAGLGEPSAAWHTRVALHLGGVTCVQPLAHAHTEGTVPLVCRVTFPQPGDSPCFLLEEGKFR